MTDGIEIDFTSNYPQDRENRTRQTDGQLPPRLSGRTADLTLSSEQKLYWADIHRLAERVSTAGT